MEFINVVFPKRRIVYVDGQEAGLTNRTLRINRGRHTIHLGDPRDYRPQWRRVDVTGTTSTRPLPVVFDGP